MQLTQSVRERERERAAHMWRDFAGRSEWVDWWMGLRMNTHKYKWSQIAVWMNRTAERERVREMEISLRLRGRQKVNCIYNSFPTFRSTTLVLPMSSFHFFFCRIFHPFALPEDCLRLLFGLIFILINLSLLVSNIFHFHVQLYLPPLDFPCLSFWPETAEACGEWSGASGNQVIDAFLMRISVD